MFKKSVWRYILFSVIWVGTLAGLVVLMSFIEIKKAGVTCKNVQVIIPGSQYFIDKQEVENILGLHSKELIGRRLETINIHQLEARLKRNPFVESARVYADMDGIITVEIGQRQPVLRILNNYAQDFYVDQHGLKIPLSDNFTAKVLVANGFINELFSGSIDTLHNPVIKDVFKTSEFIRRDSLWSAQVAQIYVNQQQEIELIPRVGNQRILLGNADSLSVKFRNLLAFYKQAIPQVGWAAYATINIKYTNQVIGIKTDNTKRDTSKIKTDTLTTATKDTSNIIKHQ